MTMNIKVKVLICILIAGISLSFLSCNDADDVNGSNKNKAIKGYKNKKMALNIIEDGKEDFNTSDYKISSLDKNGRDLVNCMNVYSINTFRGLTQEAMYKNGNLFVSGYSIEQVLALLANATEGTARYEIMSALGYGGTVSDFNAGTLQLVHLLKSDQKRQLSMKNSIWMQNQGHIYRSYISNVTNYLDADIYAIDFSSSDAGNTINRWSSDNTNSMIDKLFDDGPLLVNLVFANATYFKSDWTYKFNKRQTRQEPFHNMDGTVSNVDMMRWDENQPLLYANMEKMNVVNLPYEGNTRMAVALPDEGIDINECLNSFTADTWNDILTQFHSSDKVYLFDVIFPKVDMSSTLNLTESLKSQGAGSFFAQEFDFARLSPEKHIIGEMMQKSRIIINEDGTEAAAVTYTGDIMSNPTWGEQVEFRLDRPFFFVIYDTTTNAILFTGCVNNL